MSLLGTLAKVAVGVAVAKGVSTLAQNRGTSRSSGGSGSSYGGPNSLGRNDGSLGTGDLLGMLTGKGGAMGGGGLGGLLDGLSQASRPSGGLAQSSIPTSGSFGDMLNQSLDGFGEPATPPAPNQEETAKVLLRAMLQAAKSDGRIDASEKGQLMEHLGDISQEEMTFVNDVLAAPIDVHGLAADVPAGMENQVYMMSLLAIDLDQQAEAKYLHELAQALNISPSQANAIHQQMGEPELYS